MDEVTTPATRIYEEQKYKSEILSNLGNTLDIFVPFGSGEVVVMS